VLDYAWAEIPSNMSATSLRPLIESGRAGKEMVLSEFLANDQEMKGTCVRTAKFKYEYWGHGELERFYDLQNDPLERRNLIDDARYGKELSRHRKLMIERLMHTPA
jgi:hypothetical protein